MLTTWTCTFLCVPILQCRFSAEIITCNSDFSEWMHSAHYACGYMNILEKHAGWDREEEMRHCSLLIVTLNTSEML